MSEGDINLKWAGRKYNKFGTGIDWFNQIMNKWNKSEIDLKFIPDFKTY